MCIRDSVSDMDIDDVSFKNVVLGLQELYGKCIAPFHFPLRENEKFVGYVNVIQERAKRWQADGTLSLIHIYVYSTCHHKNSYECFVCSRCT